MLSLIALLLISSSPAWADPGDTIWSDWRASRSTPLNAAARSFRFSTTPKVRLLFFWASWCDVCKAAQFQVDRWAKDYPPEALEIQSISLEESGAAARKRAEEIARNRYPIWYSGTSLHASLKVPVFPSFFLLDGKSNQVLTAYSGYTKAISSELTKRLRKEASK